MNNALVAIGLLLLSRSPAESQALITVGGERGVAAEFGEIRDVAVLPRYFVVLDKNAPHLR